MKHKIEYFIKMYVFAGIYLIFVIWFISLFCISHFTKYEITHEMMMMFTGYLLFIAFISPIVYVIMGQDFIKLKKNQTAIKQMLDKLQKEKEMQK